MGVPPEKQPPAGSDGGSVQPPPLPGDSGGRQQDADTTGLKKPASPGAASASGGKSKTVLIAVLAVVALAVAGTLAFNAFYPSGAGVQTPGGPALKGPAARSSAQQQTEKPATSPAKTQQPAATGDSSKASAGQPAATRKPGRSAANKVSPQQAKAAAAASDAKEDSRDTAAAADGTTAKPAAKPPETKVKIKSSSRTATAKKPAQTSQQKTPQKKQPARSKEFETVTPPAGVVAGSSGGAKPTNNISISSDGRITGQTLYNTLPPSNSLIDVSDITKKKYDPSDALFDWPGGQSAGVKKSFLDETPDINTGKRSPAEEEFNISKKFYMVLVSESKTVEPLRELARELKLKTLAPEIKKTVSHGQPIYWLTVGHYTNKNAAGNKAREISSMGYRTTIVSEVVHY